MRLPRVQNIRSLLLAIAVVAVAIACLRPRPRLEIHSNEQAIEIATALVIQDDPSFRPERHKARIYQECGMSPVVVDLYSETDTDVVKRVYFTRRDGIEGPETFECDQHVESSRYGPGMYVLDRTGKVIGLVRIRGRTGRRADRSRRGCAGLQRLPSTSIRRIGWTIVRPAT